MVLGSINMDIVARTAHHPRPGETVPGHNLNYYPGGKGSNQAVAASRLYDDVHLIGKLGQDAFGQKMHTFLQEQNLQLEKLMFSESDPTGIALIILDEHSENTIVVVSGSNSCIKPEELVDIRLEKGDVIISQFEVPPLAIYELFKQARTQQAITVLNAAPAAPMPTKLLPLVDYLIVNETELAFFANAKLGEGEVLVQQAQAIRASDQQNVIVTLGAQGSLCVSGDDVVMVPGFQVEVVDTTGAGDCFVGALAASIASNQNLVDALYFANAAAALSVQKEGASPSMPEYAEVEAFLKQKYSKLS